MNRTFRAELQAKLKVYIRGYVLSIRRNLNITKEQMAEELNIDVRSYSYIESGVYLCSFITFLSILRTSQDKIKLLNDIEEIFIEVWNEAA